MHTIILFMVLSITLCNAIDLAPVTVFPPMTYIKRIDMSTQTDFTKEMMASIIQPLNNDNEFKELIGSQFLKIIGEEISLLYDVDDNKIHRMRREYTIAPTLGIMKVYTIFARINNLRIEITVSCFKFGQDIPIQYETKTVCAKTGLFSFLRVVGSRDVGCRQYHIPRSLDANEIRQVNQQLIIKSLEIVKL